MDSYQQQVYKILDVLADQNDALSKLRHQVSSKGELSNNDLYLIEVLDYASSCLFDVREQLFMFDFETDGE